MNKDNQEKSKVVLNEEEILSFWDKENIFEKSLEKDTPKGEFSFNDGPPFATGTPHYGHLTASAIKDAIPRYKTMQGYRVPRKWGWDCHGLPIENLVEKELGVSGRDEIINKVGVKKFNDTCRAKIQEISDEWAKLIPRFGRWADMEKPYRTMDKDFMESEWWAFKELYKKGLIYEDFRSIHICPRCETTLSQSEVTEGYMDIKDLSVTVKFELEDDPGTFVLAWTTTPWTLPGNVALAIGENIDYVLVEHDSEKYILAKERLEDVFEGKEYKILKEVKAQELKGKSYKPLFDYYKDADLPHKENIWKIYYADFISDEDGTGIAHEAPAFGAEDMELARKENLPLIQHVDMTGRFKPEVKDFAGMQVKPKDDHMSTDVEIIKYLAHKGLLFDKKKIEHSYPHCWRCDTPLLNYATTSWFVAVEKMKPNLLENAKDIYWYPEHIKRGRWGRWLEGARDWSISRNRFWANTMPVWRCDGQAQTDVDDAQNYAEQNAEETRKNAEGTGCGNEVVVGSIAELEELSGQKVNDLHKDVVDEVTFKCDKCGGVMRRIPDVLDTWFNSGSVPYASLHYPFDNKDEFERRFPADFISEGADQTRAWFYYQHVLATALFDSKAFKNVIVSGIVLAEDGKKMSKRLKNYPDPMYLLNTYGADAVRLYILGSPVVRTEDLNFSEKEVAEIARKTLGRLINVYEFYELYKNDLEHEAKGDSENILDRWIITRFNELHKQITDAMEAYAIDKAVRPIHTFVDDLSTWYLRRSRNRLKGENEKDKKEALETLRFVLRKFAKLIAPFAPFNADWLWQKTKRENDPESVHLASWCSIKDADKAVLEDMHLLRELVTLALDARKEAGIKVRQPLAKLSINKEKYSFSDELLQILADEVNVKEVVLADLQKDLELDTEITPELKEEGDFREVLRAVQQARKKANLKPGEFAKIKISAPKDILSSAQKFQDEIKKQAFAESLEFEEGEFGVSVL